ncbi:hypothetical protein GCM10027280_42540 [Micromonospora polyrhachis]
MPRPEGQRAGSTGTDAGKVSALVYANGRQSDVWAIKMIRHTDTTGSGHAPVVRMSGPIVFL